MSVSSVQSGYQLIQQSQQFADQASNDIARASSSNPLPEENPLYFNNVEATNKELIKQVDDKPSFDDTVIKLNQASTYSRLGVTLIQRSNDIIGTMLDTRV